MRSTAFLTFLLLAVLSGTARSAEIEVVDGDELYLVLSGGELRGQVLDDGDAIVLGGEEEIFSVSRQPEPYYKGLRFTVRTSAARPPGKRQVTIVYSGSDTAEIFAMTEGKVELSNIMLDGWSLEQCCPY